MKHLETSGQGNELRTESSLRILFTKLLSIQSAEWFTEPRAPTLLDLAGEILRKVKGEVQHTTGHEGQKEEQSQSSTLSLTSALDGVGGQSHVPAALPPRKRLGTHCLGGWVSPKAGLDGGGNFSPHRNSIPGTSSPQRIAILIELTRPMKYYVPIIQGVPGGMCQTSGECSLC